MVMTYGVNLDRAGRGAKCRTNRHPSFVERAGRRVAGQPNQCLRVLRPRGLEDRAIGSVEADIVDVDDPAVAAAGRVGLPCGLLSI